MILNTLSQPFKEYVLNDGPCPDDFKGFQKAIIRESKISRNNEPRQTYDYEPATEDNPLPNHAKRQTKLNPPIRTKPYQDLLQAAVNKLNGNSDPDLLALVEDSFGTQPGQAP